MDKALNSKTPLSWEAEEKTLSRRRLLQALAATGGSIAASSVLPDKWIAPVVEVGYLPAHAQASVTPTPVSGNLIIFNLSRILLSLNDCRNGENTGSILQIRFEYDDPLGGVGADGNTVTHHTSIFLPNNSSNSFDITLQAAQITGDGFKGVINYQLCTRFGSSTAITTSLFVTVGSRQSNQLKITSSKPVGAQDQEIYPPSEEPF